MKIKELLNKPTIVYFRHGKNHPWHKTNSIFFSKEKKRGAVFDSTEKNLTFINNFQPHHWIKISWNNPINRDYEFLIEHGYGDENQEAERNYKRRMRGK